MVDQAELVQLVPKALQEALEEMDNPAHRDVMVLMDAMVVLGPLARQETLVQMEEMVRLEQMEEPVQQVLHLNIVCPSVCPSVCLSYFLYAPYLRHYSLEFTLLEERLYNEVVQRQDIFRFVKILSKLCQFS